MTKAFFRRTLASRAQARGLSEKVRGLSARAGIMGTALAAGALFLACPPVHAAPLERAECERLDKERERLEQAGVRDDLARGPAEAKARLASDRLQAIATLIEIDEKLLFRCPGFRSLLTLREDLPDPPEAVEAKAGAGDDPKGAVKPKAKPASRSKPKAGEASEPASKPREPG